MLVLGNTMSTDQRNCDVTATRAGKSLVVKNIEVEPDLLLTFRIWRLYVMLSKRQDNKTRQCTVRFLDDKVEEVDYAGEDELKQVLERITTKVNAITAMGLFKMKKGNVSWNRNALRRCQANGDIGRLQQTHFLNWEFYYKKEKGTRGPPKYNGELFVSELCRITSVVAPLVCDNNYVTTLEETTVGRMFFLNLDFLNDDFFAWDGQSDPFLQVASHYLEGKRKKKVCLEYLSDEEDAKSLMHRNDDHVKKTFGTVKKLREHCHVMANDSMHICAFNELSGKLRMVRDIDTDLSVKLFWKTLSMILVPPSMTGENVGKAIPHTTTMLLTTKNAQPQAPHFDYSIDELNYNQGRNKEQCHPWAMDFALAKGGFRLNVWDGEAIGEQYAVDRGGDGSRIIPETNHAILLSVPRKKFFLMRGDVIHGGALDNRERNGALRLHLYLSPGAKNEKEAIAHNKWQHNWVYSESMGEGEKGDGEEGRKSLSRYLVDSTGKAWTKE